MNMSEKIIITHIYRLVAGHVLSTSLIKNHLDMGKCMNYSDSVSIATTAQHGDESRKSFLPFPKLML